MRAQYHGLDFPHKGIYFTMGFLFLWAATELVMVFLMLVTNITLSHPKLR